MKFKFAAAIVFATLLPTISFAANSVVGTHHYVVSPGTSLRAGEPGKNEFFIIGAQSNSVPHIVEQTENQSPIVADNTTGANKGNTVKLAKALKHAFHKSKSITNPNQKAFAKNRQHKKTLVKKQQAHKPVASKAVKKKQIAFKHTVKAKHKVVARKATHSHSLHG